MMLRMTLSEVLSDFFPTGQFGACLFDGLERFISDRVARQGQQVSCDPHEGAGRKPRSRVSPQMNRNHLVSKAVRRMDGFPASGSKVNSCTHFPFSTVRLPSIKQPRTSTPVPEAIADPASSA
jgi:hypothetical protein